MKRELQAQGLKVTHYSAREITSWARLYVEDHHEALMPEAIANARAMILGGVLGKRAAKQLKEQLINGQFEGEENVANG